ncbi:Peroxisomal acyl-coenzyme A oxidase 2 [Tetrabaena socialis]|uniref:acyl-CoA oxidase n=1 Tax=Tetrabaena socialis TaxID=47790 RepID=A0A2J8AGT1_9CHLO|nr:Peroxisomal acyl-coenzyme A oxidase 2 [Tetrabaena socialis]|eukprot:PNH11730.1 Peroxisomal acyl-coenzyme A oxidase 2 [Tetrabaena socialis]
MAMTQRVVDQRTLELQRPASDIILSTHVEPMLDIAAERRRCTFNVPELSYVLNGSKELLEKKQQFSDMLAKTSWGDKSQRYFLGREEEYALCTWITADGIEECRRTCGGHGYSKLSGLPTLFQNYVQNVTWEGDNNVLCLQTARHLLKHHASRPAVFAPLRMGGRAAGAHPSSGGNPLVRWYAATARRTSAGSRAGGAAKAHCTHVLHATFLQSVARLEAERAVGPDTAAVLRQLAALFALEQLERGGGLAAVLEDGYLSASQAASARAAHRGLLAALRPNAVALVDAFAFPDYLLHSALGRRDGDVYRGLLDMAAGSPLNASAEGPAWEGVLRPVLAARSRM